MKTLIAVIITFFAIDAHAEDCYKVATDAMAKATNEKQAQQLYNDTMDACADRNNLSCYPKLLSTCTKRKPKPKPKLVVPPAVVVVPQPVIKYRDRIVVKVVEKKVGVLTPFKVLSCPGCPKEPVAVAGVHVGLGVGVQDPYFSGQVGFRLQIPKVYLGLEIFSLLQYGVGAQLLPYVYRGKVVKVHVLDPGFLVTGGPFKYISDKDVPRNIDLLLGAGIQVNVACHLALTADWRVAIPDPGVLAKCGECQNGRKLDAGAAVGNAFAQSQLVVGLLVHD